MNSLAQSRLEVEQRAASEIAGILDFVYEAMDAAPSVGVAPLVREASDRVLCAIENRPIQTLWASALFGAALAAITREDVKQTVSQLAAQVVQTAIQELDHHVPIENHAVHAESNSPAYPAS